MKLTKFFKLRQALVNLDVNFIAKKIGELEEQLTNQGKPLEPANTAVTEEGIFYINPESGMATKVVLYEADHVIKLKTKPKREIYQTGYTERQEIERLHPYHLLRCNILSQAERDEWDMGYRIAQRVDGNFFYRFIKETEDPVTEKDIYQEIEAQRLMICQNCFMKINSLLEGVLGIDRDYFQLGYFFNVDFFASWCRYGDFYKGKSTLANMYPKDWQEISRIRKEQVQYHCECCNEDYSAPAARKMLHVQPIDHFKKKISYVRLQSICAECLDAQNPHEGVEVHEESDSL
ncbi:MAG: hypothetical protein DCC75_04450 [Proteobacteria bacterium]|nr:MAG: hypothetical protein DCC75_04450 [Pseudomonadota bacterium]